MTGEILYPPEETRLCPHIFLAGPIQGARDWQAEAIEIIHRLYPSAVIANPRRAYVDDTFDFGRQVDWETETIRSSDTILFWCAAEIEHDCGRAFAQTTRFELGEALMDAWWDHDEGSGSKHVVIGFEDGFPGQRYIRHRIDAHRGWPVSVADTLEAACQEAVALIHQED